MRPHVGSRQFPMSVNPAGDWHLTANVTIACPMLPVRAPEISPIGRGWGITIANGRDGGWRRALGWSGCGSTADIRALSTVDGSQWSRTTAAVGIGSIRLVDSGGTAVAVRAGIFCFGAARERRYRVSGQVK